MKNKPVFVLVLMLNVAVHAFSQSIRKDYYEMPAAEREEYVNVMNRLHTNNVVGDFVTTHQNSDYARHQHQEFLPWHRIMIHYFEKAAKAENKYINLAYMNWFPTPMEYRYGRIICCSAMAAHLPVQYLNL